MEIVIHGTKGGYKVLYPQNATKTFVNDFRSAGSTENPVGQFAYSLSFTENGCVFSKYAIIRDSLREMATGTIAVSALVPYNQKLKGVDAIGFLDSILDQYFKINVTNYNLVHAVDEFSYVDEIKNQFSLHPTNTVRFNVGKNDPAYIYYESKEHLSLYFDQPYQPNYESYSQVFFIEKSLENESKNPLKVLRHTENANLTNEIDLQNPEFSISFPPYVKVYVNLDDNPLQLGDKIKKNDLLRINYFKKFHKPLIPLTGKVLSDELKNYVTQNDNSIQINPIVFEPEIKFVKVKVLCNGKDEKNAKITILNFQSTEGPDLKFRGEEIGKNYQISASKNDLISEIKTFSPEHASEITLNLRKNPVIIEPTDPSGKKKPENKHIKTTKIFLGSLLVAIIVFVGLDYFMMQKFLFPQSSENETISIEQEHVEIEDESEKRKLEDSFIISYIEGTDYLLDSLKQYKEIWKSQKEDTSIVNWSEINGNLDNAIEKRTDIDAFIFKSADRPTKKTYTWSNKQKELKTSFIAITKNEVNFEEFKNKSSDISKLKLNELNDSIQKFLDSKLEKVKKVNPSPMEKKTEINKHKINGPGSKRVKS